MDRRAIIIAGPTAVGKTEIGVETAKILGGEIISADARQIYSGMAIGTCAPQSVEIPHHLVGYLSPAEKSTAHAWAELAAECLEEIRLRGKVPIVVGGTGLYMEALTRGMFEAPRPDRGIREGLNARLEAGEDLYALLKKIDPTAAENIHPNNRYRLLRALEVFYSTGKTLTENFGETKSPAEGWCFAKFFVNLDRKSLYSRIHARTVALLEGGWIEETQALVEQGFNDDSPGLNAIGYREVLGYLRGETDFESLTEEIARMTRNYAKRQITWFSRREGFTEIEISEMAARDCAERIAEKYCSCNENT